MTGRKLGLIFAGCFTAVLIATLPLPTVLQALDLDGRGVSYSRASGTVWNGTIAGLSWRGQPLGDAAVALKPLSLFLGRLGMDFALDGGTVTGQGFVALSFGGIVADDLALSADVANLPLLLPLAGKVAMDLEHAVVSRAGCRHVAGTISTDALVNRPAGLPWTGPKLAGSVTCSEGVISVPLQGDTGADSVTVALTLDPSGMFGIRIDARTPNQALVSALSAVGFTEADGVMTLTQRGRWS